MILNAAQLDSKFFRNFPSSKIWKEGNVLQKTSVLDKASSRTVYDPVHAAPATLLPRVFYISTGFCRASYISCSNNISCFAPSKHDKNWTSRDSISVSSSQRWSQLPVPDDSVSEGRHTQQWNFHPVPALWLRQRSVFEKCHSFGGQSEWDIEMSKERITLSTDRMYSKKVV